MPCNKPLKAWRSREGGTVVFNKNMGWPELELQVPCGQCMGCRLERVRQWAVRLEHESQMHDKNCWITLTYDDDNLPYGGTLVVEDFQKFMKRLRQRTGAKMKYFHCGEYGDDFDRPHYHACLFGFDFKDKEYFRTINGNPYFISSFLSSLWPLGHHLIGFLTFDTCAYTAGYCTKKVHSSYAFTRVNRVGDQWFAVRNEYGTGSNGLGLDWFKTFHSDIWNGVGDDDFAVTSNGLEVKPPRYYFKKLQARDEAELGVSSLGQIGGYSRTVRSRRKVEGKSNASLNTPMQLKAREAIQIARHNLKRRNFDENV